jgi:dihydroneopterin aldolase
MDTVFIRNLTIETIIGIHDWEKRRRRPVILDLELGSDCARAAATDRIADALDYDAVTRRLTQFVGGSHFELVETLAEHCATILRDEFAVPWVRLRLNKPGALGPGVDVGVVIERGEQRPASDRRTGAERTGSELSS